MTIPGHSVLLVHPLIQHVDLRQSFHLEMAILTLSIIDLPFGASNWSASPWHMDTVYTQSQSFQHARHLGIVLLRKSLGWRLCTMWLWVFQKQGLVALGATCRVCESRFALWGLIYSPDEKLAIRSHRSSESWFWSSTSIFTSIDCDRILK